MTFSVGDVVKLRSGGPAMTVEAVKGEKSDWFHSTFDYVSCTWVDAAGQTKRDVFKSTMLESVRR